MTKVYCKDCRYLRYEPWKEQNLEIPYLCKNKACTVVIELENGKISGQAVTNPTFEQYQISVGKVWKIMEDGRAWIAVKIG